MTTHDTEALAAEFEVHRHRLVGVAYRVLGSLSEAEDAVQDAWLRLARGDRAEVVDLGAWLTTVTSRLCLDRLRSARAVREVYIGPWLPEPVVVGLSEPARGPAELLEVDESVRIALLVILETLTPEQRVALVLHDVFAIPFDEVADVLGTTSAAARQLASRARRSVQDAAPPPVPDLPRQRTAVEAFQRAALGGDLAALVDVLAPGVVLRSDGGGRVRAALRPVVGADNVGRLVLGLLGRGGDDVQLSSVLVNGELGFVVRATPQGAPSGSAPETTVAVVHVDADGRIGGLDLIRNPDKLRHLARVPLSASAEGARPSRGHGVGVGEP